MALALMICNLLFAAAGAVAQVAPEITQAQVAPEVAQAQVAPKVAQAQVSPELITLPVVDGQGIRFSRLSTSQGLSQTRVAQIVQDDQGFIWLGTQHGLNRFDGYEFRMLVHDTRQPESIGAVFVTALFKDRDNKIWVGGAQTLDWLDPVTEAVRHVSLVEGIPGADIPTVVHIAQDSSGAMWFATGSGLFRRDPVNEGITRFQHDPADPGSLPSNDVRFSGQDSRGDFWVGTTRGLDRFDPLSGRVTLHVPIADPVQITFFEDSQGRFWVLGAAGTGLSLLDRDTGTLTRYSFYEEVPDPNSLTGVMGMVEDDAGALWIGSPGLGLMRMEMAGGVPQLVHYANSASDPGSIAEDKVITLFKDREGNIWSGHHSAPPSHFNPRRPLFETFRHDGGNPNSLVTDFVNDIFEDSRGYLWVGNDLGASRIDRASGEYTRFRDGLSGKPMVITIAEDRNGAIWVGSYGNGIARLDQSTGQFTTYTHDPADPASLANNQVHRLLVSRDGTLWAGTEDGLSRFDAATGTFTTFKVDPRDARAQTYVSMSEAADGTLWLGTHYSGLHHFDPATGQIEVFSADPSTPGRLRDNTVPTVLIGRDGIVWAGTQSGLDRFDPTTGQFSAIHDSADAPDRAIAKILEDQDGTLWVSTNKGLLHYDPSAGTVTEYRTIVGLSGNDFTGWGSGFASPSGEMFFGGYSGGVAFFPQLLADMQPAMPIQLTEADFPFLSAGEVTAQTQGVPIRVAKALSLDYRANSLILKFAAPSFVNPSSSRYRYKLEGLEDSWREVDSSQRQASYTTLPAGEYVFRAQAASARVGWSTPGIVLPIEIRAPWWATIWFRAACLVVFLISILATLKLRTIQVEQREREFRKLAENAPDMVMRFDGDMRLFYANSLARRFVGADAVRVLSSPNADLDGVEARLPVQLSAMRLVRDSRVAQTTELQLRMGTRLLDLETRIVPERNDAQSSGTLLVIARDITQRKATEAALRRAEGDLAHAMRVATVGELTASIAHEVNQPLTGIVTNGEAARRWLSASPPNLDEVSRSLERMIFDGRRAADIIARVAALVRKTEPVMSLVDVNAVIGEALALADPEVRRWEVDARLDLARDAPTIRGDRVQIQQVILNLVSNALEAMSAVPAGNRVLSVVTRRQNGLVVITVSDTGRGLSRDQEARVFEAFYSTRPSGMGMGLSITRSIIRAHNGQIQVQRNTPRGCHFRIEIPVSQKQG